ncbi:MAG: hypothetical protein HY904_25435 [Deltaproteobacteria bacterium]|nr:hypothetical protein [Deltaproteobacteria bacterium]
MRAWRAGGLWAALVVTAGVGCTKDGSPGVAAEDGGGPNNTGGDGGNNNTHPDGGQTSSSSSGGNSGTSGGSSAGTSAAGGSSAASTSSGGSSGGALSSSSSSSTGGSSGTVAASSSATPSSSRPAGPPCASTRDCNLGALCVNLVCVPGCVTANDCPGQLLCDTGTGPNGTCVECLTANDCSGNNPQCISGGCRTGCQSGQCGWPLTCDAATQTCVRCVDDTQCPVGRVCEANDCVPGCRDNPNTCPAGSYCRTDLGPSGQCQAGCTQASDCGDPAQFLCTNNQCIRQCQVDDVCPLGSVCNAGSCVAGCRPPTRDCPRGQYCTSTTTNTVGQCLAGCDADTDCTTLQHNKCEVASHACVECLGTPDCQVLGNGATCTAEYTCSVTCDPQAGFDTCRVVPGFFCSPTLQVCVQCEGAADCSAWEQCTAERCVPTGNRPLCAPCDSDDQCGGAADLCVTHRVGFRTESACGTDCSAGQACPAGTACTEVGNPVRGRQCLPSNSVHGEDSCAAYLDLVNQQPCNFGQECGLSGGSLQGDSICSGAGASDGLCTVLCTLGGTDCPTGFTCEDPPDTQRVYPPRCGPL